MAKFPDIFQKLLSTLVELLSRKDHSTSKMQKTQECMRSRIKPWWDATIEWWNQYERKRIVLYIICVIIITFMCQNLRDISIDGNRERLLEVTELRPYLTPSPIQDFKNFPCFPGLEPSRTLRREGKCVRTLDRLNFRLSATLGESCKYLRMGEKTQICSFRSAKNDRSELYSEEGVDEQEYVENMLQVLKQIPKMVFLDIGTRLGVYCIAAAKVNNKTVCLDANYRNLQQIQRSLFVGGIGLWMNAMVIWNKLSNKHGVVKFRIPAIDIDVKMDDKIREFRTYYNQRDESIDVNTIKLNDLQNNFRGKQVFIKFDIGANEEEVLDGAKQFFKIVDVRIVQMAFKKNQFRQRVLNFFKNLYFYPFVDPFGNKLLDKDHLGNEFDRYVYFIKKNPFNDLKL